MNTPLHVAALSGNAEVCLTLLEKGASINAVNKVSEFLIEYCVCQCVCVCLVCGNLTLSAFGLWYRRFIASSTKICGYHQLCVTVAFEG